MGHFRIFWAPWPPINVVLKKIQFLKVNQIFRTSFFKYLNRTIPILDIAEGLFTVFIIKYTKIQ